MSAPEQWPIGFYAPGSYACKCQLCGKQHIADKRAVHCADCTLQATYRILSDLRETFARTLTPTDERVQKLVAAHDKLLDACQQTHKDGGSELAQLVFQHCIDLRDMEEARDT